MEGQQLVDPPEHVLVGVGPGGDPFDEAAPAAAVRTRGFAQQAKVAGLEDAPAEKSLVCGPQGAVARFEPRQASGEEPARRPLSQGTATGLVGCEREAAQNRVFRLGDGEVTPLDGGARSVRGEQGEVLGGPPGSAHSAEHRHAQQRRPSVQAEGESPHPCAGCIVVPREEVADQLLGAVSGDTADLGARRGEQRAGGGATATSRVRDDVPEGELVEVE